MGKEKAAVGNSFVRELTHVGVYKRSQGRIARQVTLAALAVAIVLGCYQLKGYLAESNFGIVQGVAHWAIGDMSTADAKAEAKALAQTLGRWVEYGVPMFLLIGSVWICYRLVNYQRFADFLIAVEAEMNKVSWPSRTELFRSSLIVILVIFVLASVLFSFDMFWSWLFRFLQILPDVTK